MLSVGYVVDRFPQRSQTFVRNEIRELRRQGVRVSVVSLEPGDLPPAAEEVADLLVVRSLTTGGLVERVTTRVQQATHRERARRAAHVASRLGDEVSGADGHIPAWKLPAVSRWLSARGVTRLHAHFGWQGAGAAWVLSELMARPWSVTLHANDIFSRRRNLEAKLAAAHQVITVCEYNRRYLRDEVGVERPIELVVCGVEVPPSLTPERRIDVVAAGRLVPKKGFDVLVHAAARLRDDFPSLRVAIVGDGPERGSLVRLVDELDLGGTVVLRGALDHQLTLAAIGEATVFCLPARIAADGDRDSMPVVVKEAMAHAVPVVATDVVGISEMVDPTCGRLVAPDDPHHLAKEVGALLADRELAAHLGHAGRRRVEERFALTREVAKLADFLTAAPARPEPPSW